MKTTATADTTTAATRHPAWTLIVEDIEARFPPPMKCLGRYAIDAVSAHLLGDPERERKSLKVLGESAAADVRTICAKYSVTLNEE